MSLFFLEIILLIIYMVLVLTGVSRFLMRGCVGIDHLFGWVYRRDGTLVLGLGLISLLLSVAITFFMGVPEPRVHDEFSYLLASDTFSHARLSNPPHPFAIHFETFHVLQHPYYLSKYPPGQGFFLAIGQSLFHHPIAGVWLSLSLASAAIGWMLRAWLSLRGAFWVGMIAILQLHLLGHMLPVAPYGYWGQSFWGGAVAALGGALLYGAWGRLRNHLDWKNSSWFGLGMILLAFSRPYEGLLAVLPVLVLAGRKIRISDSGNWAGSKRQFIRPFVFSSLLLVAGVLIYNYAGTGSYWEMPFQKYEKTYAAAPLFLFAPERGIPSYNHSIMKQFYVDQMLTMYRDQLRWKGFCLGVIEKVKTLFEFFFNLLLCVPMVCFLGKQRMDLVLKMLIGVVVFGLFSETWMLPHYAAPFCGLIFLCVGLGLRNMASHEGTGKALISNYPALLPGLLLCAAFLPLSNHLGVPSNSWRYVRARIEKDLSATGKHLLLVKYAPPHLAATEWVYNKAEIDQAPVVWARSIDPGKDKQLARYFNGREIWIVEPDQSPVRLTPYPLRDGS